jgi:hypothetical protein
MMSGGLGLLPFSEKNRLRAGLDRLERFCHLNPLGSLFGEGDEPVKTHVLVFVPYDVPATELTEAVDCLLNRYRFDVESLPGTGRFDYLVAALEKSLNDPVAEARLPNKTRRAWSGNICDKSHLPRDLVPGALITLDGTWHDLSDFGWRMVNEPSTANEEALACWSGHYRELLAAAPDCWVVEVWAHS